MKKPKDINTNHKEIRSVLRIVGPCLLVVGGLFMLVGMISFFTSFGSFGPPRYFWCCFVGAPLMFFGFVITNMGFMGAISRYTAGESAPVAKDTFNYLADGTRDGVRDIAGAITEGVHRATVIRGENVECPKCQDLNDPNARFCDQCGEKLATFRACGVCSTPNHFDANFCDNCGEAF